MTPRAMKRVEASPRPGVRVTTMGAVSVSGSSRRSCAKSAAPFMSPSSTTTSGAKASAIRASLRELLDPLALELGGVAVRAHLVDEHVRQVFGADDEDRDGVRRERRHARRLGRYQLGRDRADVGRALFAPRERRQLVERAPDSLDVRRTYLPLLGGALEDGLAVQDAACHPLEMEHACPRAERVQLPSEVVADRAGLGGRLQGGQDAAQVRDLAPERRHEVGSRTPQPRRGAARALGPSAGCRLLVRQAGLPVDPPEETRRIVGAYHGLAPMAHRTAWTPRDRAAALRAWPVRGAGFRVPCSPRWPVNAPSRPVTAPPRSS